MIFYFKNNSYKLKISIIDFSWNSLFKFLSDNLSFQQIYIVIFKSYF